MSEPQSRQSHVDRAEDDRQMKPTWPDRSGVEDRKPTILPEKWHVRMPAHHGVRPLRPRHRRDLRPQLGTVDADVNQQHPEQRL